MNNLKPIYINDGFLSRISDKSEPLLPDLTDNQGKLKNYFL